MHTSYKDFIAEDFNNGNKYQGGFLGKLRNTFGARVPEMDAIAKRLDDAAQEVSTFNFGRLWSEPWRTKDGNATPTPPSSQHLYNQVLDAYKNGLSTFGMLAKDANSLAAQVNTFKALDYQTKVKLSDGLRRIAQYFDFKSPEDVKSYDATCKLGNTVVDGYAPFSFTERDPETGHQRMELGQNAIVTKLHNLSNMLKQKSKMTGEKALAESKSNTTPLDEQLVKKAAKIAAFASKHDVDYGIVFVKPETKSLFVVCGDGAGFDTPDEKVDGMYYSKHLEKMAKELGFEDAELADEYFPKEGEGWVKVKKDGTTEKY